MPGTNCLSTEPDVRKFVMFNLDITKSIKIIISDE
jgi:hypothetical protein